jgi:transaldolase
MKFFLDSAVLTEAQEVASWGILDGITTNPSLVAKAGGDFETTVKAMAELVPCVSAQVTGETFEEMKEQATLYSGWHKNVYVKVPMTIEGLKTLKWCSNKGIRTNTTLIFSLSQAVMAAKAGATIISPFVGRIDDNGGDGMELIANIMQAWDHYQFDTEVLVASTRSVIHINQAMQIGAHIATIPYKLFQKMPKHVLTSQGLEKFMADWNSIT